MRIAIVLAGLVVAIALVGLLVLSRDSPQSPSPPVQRGTDAMWVKDALATPVSPRDAAQDAPSPTEESPQLRAVRSSGIAREPWVSDAEGLVYKLAPGASTTCFVAGCVVEVPPSTVEAAQRAFAADTSWTGGKQWIGATLILYRPD